MVVKSARYKVYTSKILSGHQDLHGGVSFLILPFCDGCCTREMKIKKNKIMDI